MPDSGILVPAHCANVGDFLERSLCWKWRYRPPVLIFLTGW